MFNSELAAATVRLDTAIRFMVKNDPAVANTPPGLAAISATIRRPKA